VLAKDYVEAKIKRKIERAQRGEYRGGSAEGCQRQFDMIGVIGFLNLTMPLTSSFMEILGLITLLSIMNVTLKGSEEIPNFCVT
jgi:hypothetical protein